VHQDTRGKFQYYQWLNITCSDITGWGGLPKDWTKANSSLDFAYLGDSLGECRDKRYYPCPQCDYGYGNSTCSKSSSWEHPFFWRDAGYFDPYLNILPCVVRDCPFILERYNASILYQEDFPPARRRLKDHISATGIWGVHRALVLRVHFVRQLPRDVLWPSEQTELLLWLNNTCSTVPSFSGLPSNCLREWRQV
jgi:hypothetical protein